MYSYPELLTQGHTMLTKQQTKIVTMALQHANNGNNGSAARVLSSLYRCALKRSQQAEIMDIAERLGFVNRTARNEFYLLNADFMI